MLLQTALKVKAEITKYLIFKNLRSIMERIQTGGVRMVALVKEESEKIQGSY